MDPRAQRTTRAIETSQRASAPHSRHKEPAMRNGNANLSDARRNKNDEFYTQWRDIENEMIAYHEFDHDVFRGKTVLCPCDDPEWSEFTRFFAINFKEFGLKKLICTSYAKGAANRRPTPSEQGSPLFDESKTGTHGKAFIVEGDANGDGEVNLEDISFKGYLEGDGDFRSAEVTAYRDEADIIVTNPPFSLFREFLAWIVEADKKFVIIGNMNAITYKEVFPLIRNNEMWLGYRSLNKDMYFNVPEDRKTWLVENKKEGSAYKILDGVVMGRLASAVWFTNLDHGKRHEKMMLDTYRHNLKFNKKLVKKLGLEDTPTDERKYPKYDNYDAIEVPVTMAIPSDYDGVMGVPITFLDKYNPEQFEIVSFRKGEDGKDLAFTREREREFNRTFASLHDADPGDDKKRRREDRWQAYLRENNDSKEKEPIDLFFPLATNLKNGLVNDCTVAGNKTYVRVLIRKRG